MPLDTLTFYAGQSPYTDPGGESRRLGDLPGDVASLRRAALGLVLHYRDEDLSALGIPEERLREVDSRYAEKMLGRLFELDDRTLTEERRR